MVRMISAKQILEIKCIKLKPDTKQNGQNTKWKILTKWSEEKILRTNKRLNENAL